MEANDRKWSPSEKKIARGAFDAALDSALAEVIAEFKNKAAAAAMPSDIWEIEDWLGQQRRTIDETFDYRYSQLPFVFACLIRDGRIDEGCLAGLSQDKLNSIRSLLSSMARTEVTRPSPAELQLRPISRAASRSRQAWRQSFRRRIGSRFRASRSRPR